MAERAMHHRRTHNLLLFQRLVSLRDGPSPFTLILDSLEQSGNPLINEYIARAKVDCTASGQLLYMLILVQAAKVFLVYVTYQSRESPAGVDIVIKARRKEPSALQQEITEAAAKNTSEVLILCVAARTFF